MIAYNSDGMYFFSCKLKENSPYRINIGKIKEELNKRTWCTATWRLLNKDVGGENVSTP